MVARGRERLKTMFRSWEDVARDLAGLLADMASDGRSEVRGEAET
jgi:hypothetical protein